MPENILEQLNRNRRDRHSLRQIIATLSLVVILVVFWNLKLTGIGIAGEAFCGKAEHTHTEECVDCVIEEHTHIPSCYSNIHADVETEDDWRRMFTDMARGPTVKENAVLIAQSQLGYTESSLNFQVDAGGVRRGITRYGQWYGNPYGDWSAMFVSFCLHYAGAPPAPANAGPEAMRQEWITAGLYQNYGSVSATAGNIVFLRGSDGTASSVAIITAVARNNITVIEGDVDGAVVQKQYTLNSNTILGYGAVPEKDAVLLVKPAASGARSYTIWFDGTDGGLGYLTGSPDTAYTGQRGSIIRLPSDWTSPSKYSYKLRGWYDITNSRYYPAGAQMEVTGNAVLYADWVAATYDVGIFNAQVADAVSTNSFITTHLFDYNYLFNIQSANAQTSVNANSHSETWSLVASGNVAYGGSTKDFIFVDNDAEGLLCIPNNRDDHNIYPGEGIVTPGIYTDALYELLFATDNEYDSTTGSGVLGKNYLGTGDYLFQIMDDPNDPHYGYYYYDSARNAASYNQSNSRFYVYEYLEATSDSIGGAYSDFLPLNSPYVNTNGKTVGTYSYAGTNGEYNGVTHYRYDSKYNSGDYNSANNVSTDYAYGMRLDVRFYLPNVPGRDGNKDLYGNDMQFQFSGDDDLWVLIDGKLVLDIGGIHGAESGVIDFSTGQVTVQGNNQTSLMDLGIGDGDHIMTVLYLERGSSMSNCSIYFNLAPRFGLQLQKEDVLTQQLLDGTKFTVYEDFDCTQRAELWESEDAYNQDLADGILDSFQSTFTVENGIAKLWGLGSGNIYYIKETGPPETEGYGTPNGLIQLKIEREGQATYLVDVIADAEGNEPSNGFTVHGVQIDEETQTVYITVTNAPESVIETTTVQVIKKWEDRVDHSDDYIRAYLTITDPDGTVRRIREVTLSDENDWTHIWTNLPKYDYDNLTEIRYGVEESYESGYYSTVRRVTQIVIEKTQWAESLTFQNGETYLLRSSSGFLSTINNNADTGYKWVDEQTAKSSPNALWVATVNGSTVKFTNGVNQTITFYYNNGNPTDFYARIDAPASNDRQEFSYSNRSGGLQIFYRQGNTSYYMTSSMNSSGKFGYSTNQNSSMILTPVCRITQSDIRDVEDWAYEITNTPLPASNETSFAVKKNWSVPVGYDSSLYEEFTLTVRLLANGVETGRSLTLSLKNGWEGKFLGLPYKDADGNVIQYTVVENWGREHWTTTYGSVVVHQGAPPTYSLSITNEYIPGGPMLPSTGSAARLMYVLCGSAIMLGTLVYGIGSRRKRERRMG